MSVGNPIMCGECGITYHHEHPPTHCERRMTGEQLYQRMQASIAEVLAHCPPRERHKWEPKLIYGFCEKLRAMSPPDLWREFDDAMYAHGYHRHGGCGDSTQ